jgi:hypothetical protein
VSDTSTQQSTSHSSSSSGSGLAHRIGPLPVWGWLAVAIGAIILYKIIKDRSSASTSTASGTVGASDNAASTFGSEGFSLNSAGEVVDNATGDILGTVAGYSPTGSSGTGGGTGGSTLTAQQWVTNAQEALFNLGYNNATVDQALQDYLAGNQLPQNEYSIIEAAIALTGSPPAGLGTPVLSASGGTGTGSGAGGTSTGSSGGTTAGPLLPEINAQDYPLQYLFGQYSPSQFTQVGQVINGVFQGTNVAGGVPVYANLFGGMEQDFDMKTLPNGTPIYIPSEFVAYEDTNNPQIAPGTTGGSNAYANPSAKAA